jgi:RND family efflux transporter MFP subunit
LLDHRDAEDRASTKWCGAERRTSDREAHRRGHNLDVAPIQRLARLLLEDTSVRRRHVLGLLGACIALCAAQLAIGNDANDPSVCRAAADRVAADDAPRSTEEQSDADTAGPAWLGVVTFHQAVDLCAKFDGRVVAVSVRAGDTVGAGAVLAALDIRSLQRDVAAAHAALRVAQGETRRAEGELDELRRTAQRRRAMQLEGVASAEDALGADFKLKDAVPVLDVARARVSERHARVEQLQLQLAEGTIRAPFEGTIAARYVDPGAHVPTGTPILRLVGGGPARVRFAIPEDRGSDVADGTRVLARVDGASEAFTATVRQIAPEVDPAGRVFVAEAEVDADDDGTAAIGERSSGRIVRVRILD